MHTILSGSDFQESDLVGSMNFLKDGRVEVAIVEDDLDIDPGDVPSLILTTEFFMYALDREDWMLEFMKAVDKKLNKSGNNSTKARLTVIEGGLGKVDNDS